MLADVNIDHVVAFLGDAKSVTVFARTSRRMKGIVYANVPAALNAAKHNITKFEKETLSNLGKNAGIGHLKARSRRALSSASASFVRRVTKAGFVRRGGSRPTRGCMKSLETNVRCVNGGIPTEPLPLVRWTIPVNARGGYSSYHGPYKYEAVIPEANPDAVPESMTLAHFYEAHANKVSAWLERMHGEERPTREARTSARGTEGRVPREAKGRGGRSRVSIKGIVNTTYLK